VYRIQKSLSIFIISSTTIKLCKNIAHAHKGKGIVCEGDVAAVDCMLVIMSCWKGKVHINFHTQEKTGMGVCIKMKFTLSCFIVFKNIVCVSCSAMYFMREVQ
jgi:hypothetical protein